MGALHRRGGPDLEDVLTDDEEWVMFRVLSRRLRAVFRKADLEQELDQEIRKILTS